MRKSVTRWIMYFGGLFILALGVAVSVKSDFGVSPVSSIPYTMTCVWGVEMGKATVCFYAFLVALQALILRKNFKAKYLLQIFAGIIYGYFTTFTNQLMGQLPVPETMLFRITELAVSIVLVAVGLFFYVPADIMQLPPEGVMQAISRTTGIDFPKTKICFDVTVVIISLIVCLCMIRSMGSVGVGTIAAAILVGTVLKAITGLFGKYRDRLLYKNVFKSEGQSI